MNKKLVFLIGLIILVFVGGYAVAAAVRRMTFLSEVTSVTGITEATIPVAQLYESGKGVELASVITDDLLEKLTPQIVAVLVPNELGGIGEPMVKELLTCRDGIDCDLSEELLGISVATRYKTTLASSMTSAQSTVPVSSILSYDGQTLSMDTLGVAVYLTLEPGTAREEITRCTLIVNSQWAGCTRGLQFYGTSETASTTLQRTHNAGTIVIMSNVHYLYENLVDKDASENIGGRKTFTSSTIRIGNGATTDNKSIQANNGDANLPFIRYNETANVWQSSDNGVDTLNIVSSSAGGLAASSSRAIGVTDSNIHLNIMTATSALRFVANGASLYLTAFASSTTGLAIDGEGIYLNASATSSVKFDGNRLVLWVSSTGAILQDTNGIYANTSATSSLKIDGNRIVLWVSSTGAILQDTNGISVNFSATSSLKIDGNRLVLWASSTRGFAQDTNGLYLNVSSTLLFQNSLLAVNGSKVGLANAIVVGDEGGRLDSSWLPAGLTGNVNADALHFHSNNEKIFATTTNITAFANEGTRTERAIMVTTTIPGGSLNVSSTIHAVINIGNLQLQGDAGGTADGIRFRMRYGGTTIADTGEISYFGATDAQGPAKIEAWVYASTTSAQEGVIEYNFGSTTGGSPTSTRAMGFGTAAIDSTANQALVITVDFQCTACSAVYFLETRDYLVELIQ